MKKMPLIYEMETNDPDDFLTLLLALDHPCVELEAVLLTPGTIEQVKLVKWALQELKREDVKIGVPDTSCMPLHGHVSEWHKCIPFQNVEYENIYNSATILKLSKAYKTLLIGAPPKNIGSFTETLNAKQMFIQGGFAGDSLVEPQNRLEKFEGMESCVTHNLPAKKSYVQKLADFVKIPKYFVSKNVCHGIVYNKAFHDRLNSVKKNRKSLQIIYDLMNKTYIKDKKEKALHDPFAFCCMIDPSIAEWKEIHYEFEKGKFKAIECEGTKNFITVSGDQEKFFQIFASNKEPSLSKEEVIEKLKFQSKLIKDEEIWSLDCTIAEFALPRLYHFKKQNDFCKGIFFDKEELDKIIFSMEHMVLFGHGFTFGHLEDGETETQEDRDRVHEGLKLFGERFWRLWI